jgi:hypothetical protein
MKIKVLTYKVSNLLMHWSRHILKGVLTISIVGSTSLAFAAIERVNTEVDKKNKYIEQGIYSGGDAGVSHTLLTIRRHYSAKDKMERVVLDLGDEKGQPLKGRVSYHQVSIEPKQSRIVIDLAQIKSSGVSPEALENIFKKSPFIAKTSMTFDPTDGGVSIVLNTKRTAQIEVFQLPSLEKASRLVLDLKPK